MSSSTVITVSDAREATWLSRLSDYAELSKPRILAMVLITATLSALIATAGKPDLWALLHTLVGTTFVAASASALNQWWEREHDQRMERTENRPLAAGRLGAVETMLLGLVVVVTGLFYLLLTRGVPVTVWAGLTWILYVLLYTPLKSRTWWNTAVGAIPGALPVVIGWTGTGAAVDQRTAILFGLVFLWQFPHFMAIAWLYRKQYAAAGLRMLPVLDTSGYRTGTLAVIGAGLVLGVSLLPFVQATSSSWLYVMITCGLGVTFLGFAIQFLVQRDDCSARRLLRSSLVYLPLQLVLITMWHLA